MKTIGNQNNIRILFSY